MQPADAAALVEKYGLPGDWAARRELAMPLRTFHALTEEAALKLQDPSLGLHLAQKMPRGSYGALEFTLRSAPNIREALERLRRYSALINGLIRFELEVRSGRAEFTQSVPGVPAVNGRVGNEFSMALAVRVLRELAGAEWVPLEAWFGHEKPEGADGVPAFFGTQAITWSRGQNGFALDLEFFEARVVSADPALLPLVEDQARRLALSRQAASDFPGEVREQTRKLLQSSGLGVAEVAKTMGHSQRTLQRRLAEHGTTFFAVLDSLREGLAREYVPNPKLGLGEIAYLLGYSDLSAFVRSFKRWTGKTPGEYRKAGM
jgi:AraC-like DNA-binding protein